MTRDEFVSLVGPCLFHVTLEGNLPSIRSDGLLTAASLLSRSGLETSIATPRPEAPIFTIGSERVTLNHQRPLIAGRQAADTFLDGHDIASWATQLDQRVFLWPSNANRSFAASLSDRGQKSVLRFNAEILFDTLRDFVDLAPINTGSAMRKPAHRGDWIYVPITDSVETFRTNRVKRGLVKRRDGVGEVSVRTDIPLKLLRRITTNRF